MQPLTAGPHATIDLDRQTSSVDAEAGASALVRLHGIPLGVVEVPAAQRRIDGGAAWARDQLAAQVEAHCRADGITDPSQPTVCSRAPRTVTGLVSVVIPTVGRDTLVNTVKSLLASDHQDIEIVVVDNRPATGRVRALMDQITDPRARVATESHSVTRGVGGVACAMEPGISEAFNAGVRAAQAPVVVFTNDDTLVDPGWVTRLAGTIDPARGVVAATGLVLPAELDTAAQRLFEQYIGFGKGFDRTVWAVDQRVPLEPGEVRGDGGWLFPFTSGVCGAGNNMAFDRRWLLETPFDETLGAGTLTRGGEDLDAFLSVLLAGKVLVYEPAAVLWDSARTTVAELRAQLWSFGAGNSAALAKQAFTSPRRAAQIAVRVPAGLRRLLGSGSANSLRQPGFPSGLAKAERRGFALGPLLYLSLRAFERLNAVGTLKPEETESTT